MVKRKLVICQFPGNGQSAHETTDWLIKLCMKLEHDPRIEKVGLWTEANTPITMLRNKALLDAAEQGADYVLMIDNDMKPDLPRPDAKPFFESSFEFMLQHDGPCVVAAPYCGPPPDESCYIFRWIKRINDKNIPDFAIEMYPRDVACHMRGIKKAAALPTGLILIDMRAVDFLPHPRFYYEWKDESESQKASTEDVVFTRDLTIHNIPVYANWDAWAGHIKKKIVGAPVDMEIQPDSIPRSLRKAAAKAAQTNELFPPPVQRLRAENIHGALPKAAPEPLVVDCRGDGDDEMIEPSAEWIESNGQPADVR
jgi:hypothetical protein